MTDQQWHDEAMRLLAICVDSCFDYEIGDGSRRYDELEALAAHLRTRPSVEPLPAAQGEREAFEALFEIDDFIARVNGNDRGGCAPVEVLRAFLAARAAAPSAAQSESIDRKINRRHCERPLEDLMAQCELAGYEKAEAAFAARSELSAAEPTAPRVRELEEALQLIAGTDPVDAALDPQRAVRVARAVLAAAGKEKP